MWRNYDRNMALIKEAQTLPLATVNFATTSIKKEAGLTDIARITFSRSLFKDGKFTIFDMLDIRLCPDSEFTPAASKLYGLNRKDLENMPRINDSLSYIKKILNGPCITCTWTKKGFSLYEKLCGACGISPGPYWDAHMTVHDDLCMVNIHDKGLMEAADIYGIDIGNDGPSINRAIVSVLGEAVQNALSYDPIKEQKKMKAHITSVGYYAGYKRQSRIYANTRNGAIYYDISTDSWLSKDYDLKTVDMPDVEAQVFRLAGVSSYEDLAQYRGPKNI